MLDEIGKAAREEGVAARGLKKWSARNHRVNVPGKIQYLGSGHIHMTPNEKCLYISERMNSTPAKEVPEEIADRMPGREMTSRPRWSGSLARSRSLRVTRRNQAESDGGCRYDPLIAARVQAPGRRGSP